MKKLSIINNRNEIFMVDHNPNITGGIMREYMLSKDGNLWTIKEKKALTIDTCQFEVVDSFEHSTRFEITALKFWIQCQRMQMMLDHGKTDWLPVTRTKQIGIITNERLSEIKPKSIHYRDVISIYESQQFDSVSIGKNVQCKPATHINNNENKSVSNNQFNNASQNHQGDINEIFNHGTNSRATQNMSRCAIEWNNTKQRVSGPAYYREQATKRKKYGVAKVVTRYERSKHGVRDRNQAICVLGRYKRFENSIPRSV